MLLFATGDNPISENRVSTDGQVAVIRRQNDELDWFLCVGGTGMKADGKELFQCDKRLTIALDSARNGYIVSQGKATVVISLEADESLILNVQAGATIIQHGKSVQ